MKKAIKITGIIWAILLGFSLFFGLLYGFICLAGASNADVVKQLVDSLKKGGSSMSDEEAKAFIVGVGTFFLVYGLVSLVGFVLDIVICVKNKKNGKEFGKAAGIIVGILAFLTGAFVPGILQFISSIIGHKETAQVQTGEEWK